MESKNDHLDELLIRNDLIYDVPRDASLVAERTFKEYQFDNVVYTAGGRPQIQLNSGADYIYGPTSYLAFTLSIESDAKNQDAGFGSASAAQLFSEVVQESASGQNLEIVQNADVVNYIRHRFEKDASFDDTYGKVTGAKSGTTLLKSKVDPAGEGVGIPIVVPMSMLSKLWSQSEPIPSHLAAGMKIRLVINSVAKALHVNAGHTIKQMYIRDLRLVCDSLRLRDSAVKELRMQSANNPQGGLKFTYSTFFTSTKDNGALNDVNIDIQKSASVPIRVMAIPRLTASVVDPLLDSYLAYANASDVSSWQFRNGSVYLPQQPIRDSARSYVHSIAAFDKLDVNDVGYSKAMSTQVGYDDFTTNKTWALAMSLYKSPSLPLSSDPTNNSRLINFAASVTTPGTGVTWTVCLEYVAVANVMLDNVVVDA